MVYYVLVSVTFVYMFILSLQENIFYISMGTILIHVLVGGCLYYYNTSNVFLDDIYLNLSLIVLLNTLLYISQYFLFISKKNHLNRFVQMPLIQFKGLLYSNPRYAILVSVLCLNLAYVPLSSGFKVMAQLLQWIYEVDKTIAILYCNTVMLSIVPYVRILYNVVTRYNQWLSHLWRLHRVLNMFKCLLLDLVIFVFIVLTFI